MEYKNAEIMNTDRKISTTDPSVSTLPNSAMQIVVSTDLDTLLSDIAVWPIKLTSNIIDHIIRNKPKNILNKSNFKSVYKDKTKIYNRGLLNDHFYRTKANGSREERRRILVFSETTRSVYCYPCKMFSSGKTKLATGFQNWKTILTTLSDHETSKEHILATTCSLDKRCSAFKRVDSELVKQVEF